MQEHLKQKERKCWLRIAIIIGEMLRKYIEQFSDRKLRIDWRVANAQFQLKEVADVLYHQ